MERTETSGVLFKAIDDRLLLFKPRTFKKVMPHLKPTNTGAFPAPEPASAKRFVGLGWDGETF